MSTLPPYAKRAFGLVGALLFVIGVWKIPAFFSGLFSGLYALEGETFIRLLALVLGFILLLAWIGVDRAEAWLIWGWTRLWGKDVIDIGKGAYLMPSLRYASPNDSERIPIHLAGLIQGREETFGNERALRDGRTLVIKESTFEDCDIYGPAVLVLAKGSVEETFVNCEWGEGRQAFWAFSKRGRYVGVIAVENCTFKRCNFFGIGVVVKPEEYRRLMG